MGHSIPMKKDAVRDAVAKGLRSLARDIQHDMKEVVSMDVEVGSEVVTYTIVVKRDSK